MLNIIEYSSNNQNRVLEIFDSNSPKYFDPSERDQFIDFFKDLYRGKYYVGESNGRIVGCGGYCKQSEGEARIVWLMIDANFHGKKAGRELMLFFENEIVQSDQYQKITLQTSQLTDVFYEKLGYKTLFTKKDHWGEGLDLYFMEKPL